MYFLTLQACNAAGAEKHDDAAAFFRQVRAADRLAVDQMDVYGLLLVRAGDESELSKVVDVWGPSLASRYLPTIEPPLSSPPSSPLSSPLSHPQAHAQVARWPLSSPLSHPQAHAQVASDVVGGACDRPEGWMLLSMYCTVKVGQWVGRSVGRWVGVEGYGYG